MPPTEAGLRVLVRSPLAEITPRGFAQIPICRAAQTRYAVATDTSASPHCLHRHHPRAILGHQANDGQFLKTGRRALGTDTHRRCYTNTVREYGRRSGELGRSISLCVKGSRAILPGVSCERLHHNATV